MTERLNQQSKTDNYQCFYSIHSLYSGEGICDQIERARVQNEQKQLQYNQNESNIHSSHSIEINQNKSQYSNRYFETYQDESQQDSRQYFKSNQDVNLINEELAQCLQKINQRQSNRKLLNDFSQIKTELLKYNYQLGKQIASGGEGIVFEGQSNQTVNQDFAIKIFDPNKNEFNFQEEINLMKTMIPNYHIIKYENHFKIDDCYVLIMEKCQFSLKQELDMILKRKDKFSIEQLLIIFFDLILALPIFRMHNKSHLHIKPSNILKNKEGIYCLSNYSNESFLETKNNKINQEIVSSTQKQQSNEEKLINYFQFKTGVYSLGKTFMKIIKVFEQTNENLKVSDPDKIIEKYKKIIKENMITEDILKRENSQNLYELFFLEELISNKYLKFNLTHLTRIKNIIQFNKNIERNKQQFFIQLKFQLAYHIILRYELYDEQIPDINNQFLSQQKAFQFNNDNIDDDLIQNLSKQLQSFIKQSYKPLETIKSILKKNQIQLFLYMDRIRPIDEFKKSLEMIKPNKRFLILVSNHLPEIVDNIIEVLKRKIILDIQRQNYSRQKKQKS